MKHPSLKTLCTAVSTLMAMATLGAQSAKASDTEIYQEAKQGTATLMLQIDIVISALDQPYVQVSG